MRPLIRIDRTALYHGGVARPLGVARCLARIVGSRLRLRSCAHGLSVGRVDRRSAPWVSGPVTACAASAAAAERATFGKRRLIRFYGVSI
jgi:hypothetical protein